MPPWSGGPCPECSDYMPANLIHCQTCRALLNTDLDPNHVEIPEFTPLQEIDNEDQIDSEVVKANAAGYYIQCMSCEQELKVSKRFLGEQVQCKHCDTQFRLVPDAVDINWIGIYTDCPHCDERIRAARRYINCIVACNFCSGQIQLLE